jgi:hypothetical protein
MRKSEARRRRVLRSRERMRVMRDCAKEEGALPGMWFGVLPVESSTFGTSRRRVSISALSSSSSSPVVDVSTAKSFVPDISSSFRISARTPQTTLVFPKRTTALPLAWVRLPVLMPGVRNSWGLLPLARTGAFLSAERWAWRKGCGEMAAKMGRGKVRAGGCEAVAAAISSLGGAGGDQMKEVVSLFGAVIMFGAGEILELEALRT